MVAVVDQSNPTRGWGNLCLNPWATGAQAPASHHATVAAQSTPWGAPIIAAHACPQTSETLRPDGGNGERIAARCSQRPGRTRCHRSEQRCGHVLDDLHDARIVALSAGNDVGIGLQERG
jgi:hypothetical protein